jgi:NAD(P)-dependent dehydrogenase (short-subunit alcohol dehydrogenase family)
MAAKYLLKDKVAIITGSNAGIGKAIATEFAAEGAKVVVVGRRQEKNRAVVEEIKKIGTSAIEVTADVGTASDIDKVYVKTLEAFGSVDIVVNNAAVIHQAEVVNTEEADWDRLIRTNLKSCFLSCKAAARQMIKQGKGGKIINVSSIHGTLSEPSCAIYTAAKGGMEAFSRTLATEVAPYKINVNCIQPGATYSELTTPMYTESVIKALYQRIPLKEIAQPEWIARGVVFLASEDSRYMTGSVLVMDGGYVMDGSLPGAKYWEK